MYIKKALKDRPGRKEGYSHKSVCLELTGLISRNTSLGEGGSRSLVPSGTSPAKPESTSLHPGSVLSRRSPRTAAWPLTVNWSVTRSV